MTLAQTRVMGPLLRTSAPNFSLFNHENREMHLNQLIGEQGLLLGFTGDIWEPASVRRILWLQRHYMQFCKRGVRSALLICDKPHMLNGFSMSSVVPLEFPLLADSDHAVHEKYCMTPHAGLILIDSVGLMRDKWIVPDERVWPQPSELLRSIDQL